ncbi:MULTISPECIES: hypothetical protein [unclassified Streptomyces]|uniref:hypothetical protein n=1 Tax=unclassified Streptomyces TaxID=2593676 RepID=UPI0015873884|nr:MULTISPECIES: hypothetical protein [unclassified Streptomyces]
MSPQTAHGSGSPIYDQVVEELGDVLNEVRALAERTHEQADDALSWDLPGRARELAETS